MVCWNNKRNTKQNILQNIGNQVNNPKVSPLFVRENCVLDEKKEYSCQINKNANRNPKMKCGVDESILRLIQLIIKIIDAI
jgi:hypothetical protein